MRKYFVLYAWVFFSISVCAQRLPDTLALKIKQAPNDSTLVQYYCDAISYYQNLNLDSSQQFIDRGIKVCKRNNQLLFELFFQNRKCFILTEKEKYADSYTTFLSILKKANEINSDNSQWLWADDLKLEQNKFLLLASAHYGLHILMHQTLNFDQSRSHLNSMLIFSAKVSKAELDLRLQYRNAGLAFEYLTEGQPDSAYALLRKIQQPSTFENMLIGFAFKDLGRLDEAKQYLQRVIKTAAPATSTRCMLKLVQIYQLQNKPDSSLFFAKELVTNLKKYGNANYEVSLDIAYQNLFKSYKALHQNDSAYKYAALAVTTMDSLNTLRVKNLTEFQQLFFNEQQRLEKMEEEKRILISRLITYGLIVGAGLIGLIAFIQFRNSRQRLEANKLLTRKNREVESAMFQLKSTQSQLIQSEKMASLGELTAGIAHEIQNPLNFVNNFSEVTNELVDEMKTELATGNQQQATEIANDIKDNLIKINHHGQRAADIVKGMLQHSRTSTGQKELTDINALCDEYLRLSYHGLRAKDKSFKAKFETDFDSSLPKINVIPQDIGRVVLNLINNAFYAVNEKAKQGLAGYEPTVIVTTKCSPLPGRGAGGEATITVKDNGNGIPEKIKEKIFQPFFTTKPTGQGTGLGLSLSYDIVKSHGGELKVETKQGEGSEFVMKLAIV